MIALVHLLVNCTGELLAWMYVELKLLSVHLICSGQRRGLLIKQAEWRANQKPVHLILKHLDLALRKLVLLQSIAHRFLLLLLHHRGNVLRSDTPGLFWLRLRRLLFLLIGHLPWLFHLFVLLIVPLRVNLPLHILIELLHHLLQLSLVAKRDKRVVKDDHDYPLELPSSDKGPKIGLLLNKHLEVKVGVAAHLHDFLRGWEADPDVLLQLLIYRAEVLHCLLPWSLI